MEMKVSMTPWLDGSRWLWPLVESELWYSTRLLEDTAGAREAAGCWPHPSGPPHLPLPKAGEAGPHLNHSRFQKPQCQASTWGHPERGLLRMY